MKLAVFGNPIAHSRSPQIHQAFAAQYGKTVDYTRIEVEPGTFTECFTRFQLAGGIGANITVPLKELALQQCDLLSPRAEQAGAVNTLILRDQQWLGHNTDGDGLVADLLRYKLKLQDARVLLVGAGGAVRGVIGPLIDAGVQQLHIANRTGSKAEALALQWQPQLTKAPRAEERRNETEQQPVTSISGGDLQSAVGAWNLVINGTASGLSEMRPELPENILVNQPFCYDMVYGSKLPPFSIWAQAHGCAVADGLGMLVEQAALSYFQWTGDVPNTQAVLDLMRSELQHGK